MLRRVGPLHQRSIASAFGTKVLGARWRFDPEGTRIELELA